MTEPFWKPSRWPPVFLLILGLLSGGCCGVQSVYQDVPATSDTGQPKPCDDTHIYRVGELVKFVYRDTNGAPVKGEEPINEEGILSLPGMRSVEAAGKTPQALFTDLKKEYPGLFQDLAF